jgi:hypothetical protein
MKILVEPIYGWGWTDLRDQPVEVPGPFELEISIAKDGPVFSVGVGRLADNFDHPLKGLWIRLSQRHTTIDGNYNLVATDVEQDLIDKAIGPPATIKVMGFAVANQI